MHEWLNGYDLPKDVVSSFLKVFKKIEGKLAIFIK